MKYLYTLFSLFIFVNTSAQIFTTSNTVPAALEEISGLIRINNTYFAHNDSGDDPYLYQVDSITQNVIRKVYIKNATNIDWEDLSIDDTHVYIGDFGNNNGSRTNLKIYKCTIDSLLQYDSVSAETIRFSYNEQSNFTPNNNHNFDAEGLIHVNNKLFLFTKNRNNFKSYIYTIPKLAGTYSLNRIDSLDVQGLITGGVYNPQSNEVVLTGHLLNNPFLIRLNDFENGQFSTGNMEKIPLNIPSYASKQIESITYTSHSKYLIASEYKSTKDGYFFTYQFDNNTSSPSPKVAKEYPFFPNPFQNQLHIKDLKIKEVFIYDFRGRLLIRSKKQTINTQQLPKGHYIIKAQYKNGNGRLSIITKAG